MQEPSLKNYDEFKKLLSNYHISAHAQAVLKDLKLVLLMAGTSTGRSVVVKKLLERGNYYYIVSDTTRPPQLRDGKMEQNGIQYYFRDEDEFLADLKAGDFLEAELIHDQQVSGISIRELERAKLSGKTAFTEADIAGVTNVRAVKPDTKAIFLLPPSFEEWLARIENRGGLTAQETSRRLHTASRFLEEAPDYGYFQYVITGKPEVTTEVINDIAEGLPNPQQTEGEALAKQLLKDLKNYLTE